MAELVGIFAASHTPVMLNFPEAIPDDQRLEIFDAFKSLGRRIRTITFTTFFLITCLHFVLGQRIATPLRSSIG
jgi:hypothetical protein